MIQFTRDKTSATSNITYINLYDEMTNSTYKPLVKVTSQLTGKEKYFIPTTSYSNKDRYVQLITFVTTTVDNDAPLLGVIFLGSTDYPLGFYDVVIYQNSSNSNLDPSGLTTIWNGLMNLTNNANASPVDYTEYTTNDSDTESVYITF
jgi:hypothetical protein